MLGGVPADAVDAHVVERLDEGLGAGDDFRVFRVEVAVVAELAVGDGVAVAVVDAAVEADAAVAVPPCVVVSGGLVHVVCHHVHDYLDAQSMGVGAEAAEVVFRAVG